jgi:CBS domain-containing protein
VEKNDKMVGMITDRDIALRVVAEGKDPAKTKVSEVMSEGISYCFEEDDVESLIDKMTKEHHGRIPVINEQKRLVGIVSLAGIGRRGNDPKLSHRIMTGLSSL